MGTRKNVGATYMYMYQKPCELNTCSGLESNRFSDNQLCILGPCLQLDCPFELFLLLNLGMLSAWDTRQNKCFIHWEGDSSEIGKWQISNMGNFMCSTVFLTVKTRGV